MLIETNKIIVNDRIRKDFGDIEELANDIKENGLINPPVVTPEYELIAGERRLRALKHLGYEQIEVRVMSVKDALHQLKLEISENENRKDFSFNEKMTWAKLLEEEYKKIAEINMKAGIPLDQNRSKVDTNKQVANDLDMGKETYRQAKYVSENATDDMIRELDAGKLSINKAFLTLKEEKEQLQSQLQQERNKLPKVIDNTDYDTINNLKSQLSRKDKDVEILKRDKDLLERKVKLNEDDAKKFNDLKTQIEFLNKEKEDIARQIQSATELSGLAVKIDHFLKTELSPIRYSRTLERMDSEVAVNNLTEIIESVESWCSEIREFLPNKNIINVEVIE
jgi:ParB family chromosome partitioning protein